LGFNRRKLEDQRREAAEKEAASRRATDAQVLEDAMATCPICKSDAEEIKSGFIDGKTFRCAKHGEYQVSDSVLKVPALMDEIRANGRPH
jgi:transposase-like protein